MSDRPLCCLLIVLALFTFFAAEEANAQRVRVNRPNVLFIVSDDQRPDSIAALGNTHIRTPHLDSLVRAGTVMTRAYCMGSESGAVCLPSRAMFNSGRSLFRVDMQLKDTPTFGSTFAGGGYETFGTGKWHNGQESAGRSFQKATAMFFGGMADHLKTPVLDKLPDGKWGNKRTGEKFSSELFADAAVSFVQSRDRSRPFFCYVAFTAPHDPRMPQGKWATMYDPAAMPLPGNYLPQHPFDNGDMALRDEALLAWPRTEAAVKKELADYYGMITHMDEQIGRILAALDAAGDRENTLIIFTSDHGLAIGSHGLLGKQNMYDHSMRAPLIFAGPGIPHGQQRDALCYLLDIFPTACALARIPEPRDAEGVSLAPVIAGVMPKVRSSLYTAYKDVQRAVRDDRWKLIRYPQIDRTQLFDLKADPLEINDLAGDPAHAEEVKRMMALLQQWQQQVGDKAPLTAATLKSPEFTPPRRGEVKNNKKHL